MSQTFNGEEKVGWIVSEFPGASNLFKALRIDFCCGGDRPLREAIQQKKLDEQEVIKQLNDDYAEMKRNQESFGMDWRAAPADVLIDHIVDCHHGYLRKELPVLSDFVTRVFHVHGSQHPELAQLHRKFHQLKVELDQHLVAEEGTLFPKFKQYESQPTVELREQLAKELDELESEHSVVGNYLKEMREITDEYALPPEACNTYKLTFSKLAGLESDLFQHIHLENNILFPRLQPQPQA